MRGLSEYPGAYTYLDNKKLKIFSTSITNDIEKSIIGTFKTNQKDYLKVKCADYWLEIQQLQIEGKKRMPIGDFLKGYRFISDTAVILE